MDPLRRCRGIPAGSTSCTPGDVVREATERRPFSPWRAHSRVENEFLRTLQFKHLEDEPRRICRILPGLDGFTEVTHYEIMYLF